MKKSLIALTVAAALAAPMLAQAESAVAVAVKEYDKYATECLANAKPGKWHSSCDEANAASGVAIKLMQAGYKPEPSEMHLLEPPANKHAKAIEIMRKGLK